MALRVLKIIPELIWTSIFVTFLTMIPILFCVISVLLYPIIGIWNRYLLTKINITLADWNWFLFVHIMETWGNSKPHFYGDKIPDRENAVIVSNHNTIIDWAFFFPVGGRRGRLGCIKFFAKESVKYWPGFGWGIYLLDGIFLKRNWTKDKDSIEAAFNKLKSRGLPFWAITFLEGTRATQKKIKESQEFCKSRGKPILNNILYPRTKGFIATIHGLRDTIDAVYDVTFTFEGGKLPTIIDLAMRRMPDIYYHIKRYPIDQMPNDDQAIAQWCEDRFVEKDKLLDYFKKEGCFPNPRPKGEWPIPYQHKSLNVWGKQKAK